MEEWRDIKGYDGIYQVSSYGRVKVLAGSFSKVMPNGGICYNKEKMLKTRDTGWKYKNILLHKDGQSKRHMVHRLVAVAFCPNPNNLQYVNHKDENKYNNHADNLEWVTFQDNVNYGTGSKRMGAAHWKPVEASKDGISTIFDCAFHAAQQLGLNYTSVCKCARGDVKTHKGYTFRYIS